MTEKYSVRYPRRVITRTAMRLAAGALMTVFTRTTVTGREHLPKHGPLILVGNHVAFVEVLLMMLYVPYLVEFMGGDDVPMEPGFAPFARTFGYIPINRGSMDRRGMTMGLDVLAQKGVVGIFPEGGIWETTLKQARTGVAWLSSKANAPLIPIGFGGMTGAFNAALALRRPRLTMNIGPMIPPIPEEVPGKTRKQALMDGANVIMERVEALIPHEEKATWGQVCDERFMLEVSVDHPNGSPIEIPMQYTIHEARALAKFFHRPVLLRTLSRNLKLPVQPLQRITVERDPQAIADAAEVALDYLETKNPFFLTYRFGNEEGGAMRAGIGQLMALARWAASHRYRLRVRPIRLYRRAGSDEEMLEDHIGSAHI